VAIVGAGPAGLAARSRGAQTKEYLRDFIGRLGLSLLSQFMTPVT